MKSPEAESWKPVAWSADYGGQLDGPRDAWSTAVSPDGYVWLGTPVSYSEGQADYLTPGAARDVAKALFKAAGEATRKRPPEPRVERVLTDYEKAEMMRRVRQRLETDFAQLLDDVRVAVGDTVQFLYEFNIFDDRLQEVPDPHYVVRGEE